MGLEEITEREVPSTIQCPECEHEIPVDPDWQEGDIFSCPSCSVEIQVTGVDPLWVDFAPETDEGWSESEDEDEDEDEISLDDVEEMEEEDDDDDMDDDDWNEPVSRRVATLQSARLRQARKESNEVVEQDVVLLTPEGAARLQAELEQLETVRLPKVTAWLADALAEGFEEEDVTELEEARSELSFVEGRIRNLQNLLASAEYLGEPESTEDVQLGSRVTVAEGDQEPETYRIVTPAEADPLNGFISNVSPLGKALIGRQVDDVVVVKSPDGPIEFRIIEIC